MFRWRVPDSGFVIRKSMKIVEEPKIMIQGPFLISSPKTKSWKVYYPLEDNQELFGTFADTPKTEEGVTSFANEYGNLHTSYMLSPAAKKFTNFITGVPLSEWFSEIAAMKYVLELERAIDKRQGLSDFLEWKDPDTLVTPKDKYPLITRHGAPEVFDLFHFDDLLLPARYLLQRTANEKLGDLEHRIDPHLVMNADNGNLEPYLLPESLIAALWFQFYEMVSGNIKLERCEICGKWENVVGKRADWRRHYSCAAKERARKSYYENKRKKAKK